MSWCGDCSWSDWDSGQSWDRKWGQTTSIEGSQLAKAGGGSSRWTGRSALPCANNGLWSSTFSMLDHQNWDLYWQSFSIQHRISHTTTNFAQRIPIFSIRR
jgi:hypothetical protein